MGWPRIWSGHPSPAKVEPYEGQTQYLRPQSIGLTEPTTPTRVGELTKVLKGRLRPEVQHLSLLYTMFDRKDTPFVCLLLANVTPFTYLV